MCWEIYPIYEGQTSGHHLKVYSAVKYELAKNPERFNGDSILFIHTGGIYGFIDGSMSDEIKKENPIVELSQILDLWLKLKNKDLHLLILSF